MPPGRAAARPGRPAGAAVGTMSSDLDGLAAALGRLNLQDDLGALGHRSESEHAQHVAVQQDVPLAVRTHDKAVALRRVEPFHLTTHNHRGELSDLTRRGEAPYHI